MKLWCKTCQKAVEGVPAHYQDEIGYVRNIQECPECGKEVYIDVEPCIICGEDIPIHTSDSLCKRCEVILRFAIRDLAHQMEIPQSKLESGLYAYLREE